MLIRLLRSHFAPYKRPVALLVVLQAIQVTAALLLPRLNANIIDQGVLTGDQGYIRAHGALMLGATLVQGVFAAAAVFVGARVAMSVGRDLRTNLFHQVTGFSAREVGPSERPRSSPASPTTCSRCSSWW